MKAIKIVVLLSVPDGCQVEVRTGQATLPDSPPPAPGPTSQPPARAPVRASARDTRADARAALEELGVDHPERYLEHYAPARIIEVCKNAEGKKNPAAWTASALRRGWTMPKPKKGKDAR